MHANQTSETTLALRRTFEATLLVRQSRVEAEVEIE